MGLLGSVLGPERDGRLEMEGSCEFARGFFLYVCFHIFLTGFPPC